MASKIQESLTYDSLVQSIEDVYKNEVIPEFNNLKTALETTRIKFEIDTLLKISSFSVPATSVFGSLVGLSIPVALLAGMGISVVASSVLYNRDKKEKLINNPYSYFLSIQNGL